MSGENFPTLTGAFQDILQTGENHFILKLKIKEQKKKKKNLTSRNGKGKGTTIRWTATLPKETKEAKRQWKEIFEMLEEK